MADSNDNIRQIYYKDLCLGTQSPYYEIKPELKSNLRDVRGELIPGDVPYRRIVIKGTTDGTGVGSIGQGNIIKLGYSCRPSLTQFPIFLKYASDTTKEYQIYIGKTGFFESQPDIWMDVNNANPNARMQQTSIVEVTEISVPWFDTNPTDYTVWNLPTDEAKENFNTYESIIEFVQSSKTGYCEVTPKVNAYKYKIKPVGSTSNFSCKSHIVAKVDSEERFIFTVNEKIPTSGCGNCQDHVGASVDELQETASYLVDQNAVCKNYVIFSGENEVFSLNFVSVVM